jgi:WhiB family redox-sensing transcriptional regulator
VTASQHLRIKQYEERPDWFDDANCKDVGDDPFFPERNTPDAYDEARKFCGPCPVRDECRHYAYVNNIRDGMWGGVVFDRGMRRREQRRKAKAAA